MGDQLGRRHPRLEPFAFNEMSDETLGQLAQAARQLDGLRHSECVA